MNAQDTASSAQLEERLRFETLIADLSSKFINVPADEGKGFDVESKGGTTLGMVSMRERVRLLQGQILIKSRPGEGARVEASVPLAQRTIG